MISLLYGENDFELKSHLRKLISEFADKNAIEKIDGDSITADNLADLLSGVSLFSASRLVIIYDASASKEVWEKLMDYVQTDTQLILVESNPDKRTKTFKHLQKQATVTEFKNKTDAELKNWLLTEAKSINLQVSSSIAEKIINRAGSDQWKLTFALQKLAQLDGIDEQAIIDHIEPSVQSNVFALIDASLNRSPAKVHELVSEISVTEDPYYFFGLFSSQMFQLVTLSSSDNKPAEVASDLGVHPYPLQKLSSISRQLNENDLKKIASIVAGCDDQIKRSGAEPWLLIEQALLKIANR